jgi:hypothetical protein
MKNMKKIFVLIILFSGIIASSFAQVVATATASANIFTPIAITHASDLSFGNISVSPTDLGTVSLAAALGATRTSNGGVTLPAVHGTVSVASFNLTGEISSTYSITMPTPITITNPTSNTMSLDLISNPGSTGTLDGSGLQTMYVGGTLHVAAAQGKGAYTGTINVTVNYN